VIYSLTSNAICFVTTSTSLQYCFNVVFLFYSFLDFTLTICVELRWWKKTHHLVNLPSPVKESNLCHNCSFFLPSPPPEYASAYSNFLIFKSVFLSIISLSLIGVASLTWELYLLCHERGKADSHEQPLFSSVPHVGFFLFRQPWATTISPSGPPHLTLPGKTTFLNGIFKAFKLFYFLKSLKEQRRRGRGNLVVVTIT